MVVLLFIFSAVFIRLPRSYTLIRSHLCSTRLSTISICSLLSHYSHSPSVFTLSFPAFYFNATSWFVLAEKLYVCNANAHDVFINPAAVFHVRLMAQLRFPLTLTLNMAISYQTHTNYILLIFNIFKTTHILSWCIAQGQNWFQVSKANKSRNTSVGSVQAGSLTWSYKWGQHLDLHPSDLLQLTQFQTHLLSGRKENQPHAIICKTYFPTRPAESSWIQ